MGMQVHLRRGIVLGALLVAAIAIGAPPKPAAPLAKLAGATLTGSVEGAVEYTWPNGFRAVLLPDVSKATIMVNLVVLVGSRQENYGEHGMAHLFEHMLFKRTKRFASIKDELTKIGGRANGTTSEDRTNYYEEIPASEANLNHAIELEVERLRSAIISRDELKTEMTVVRNELERGENDPSTSLWEAVGAAAFRWHNYGKSPIGPVSDLENVPNEKLLAWYETYYQPDNALMILSGNFDVNKAVAKLGATFGRLPRPKRKLPTTYTVEPVQDGERSVVLRRSGGTPMLMALYHGPARSDPDAAAMELLASVLSTAPSGRLYQALVATEKAAQSSCMGFPTFEPGTLVCDVTFKPGQDVATARETFLATLEQRKPISDEEANRAKLQEQSNIERITSDVHRLNMTLTDLAASDWRYFYRHRDNVDKVTAADLNRVAKKVLVSSNRTLGEYVPTEKPERSSAFVRAAHPAEAIRGYQGRAVQAAGETFDSSFTNIEANTQRGVLASGTKFAFLPKKTRGEVVRMALKFFYGTENTLTNRRVDAENVAELLTKGTTKRSRTAFQDELSKLKAELKVSTRRQVLNVYLKVPRENLEKALALVGEMLREPAFDAREFASSVSERIATLNNDKDEPMDIARRTIRRTLYPREASHYLYEPLATEEIATLKDSTLEKAKSFYSAFITPEHATVAFVGDFDPKAVKPELEAMFKGWTAPEKYAKIPFLHVPTKGGDQVIATADKPMATTMLAQSIPMSDVSPDFPTLHLANYLLGGGFLTGRIPARLREKEGMSYGAGSRMYSETGGQSAYFFTYAIYAPQNWERIKAGFKEEIEKATASGFTPEEFKRSKEGYLKERRVRFSEDGAIVDALSEYLAFNRTLAYEEAFDRTIERLTLPEVNEALKKYIDFSSLSQVSVGNYPKAPAPK